MPKYKQYFNKMLENEKGVFESFRKLHDAYSQDQDNMQEKFNEEGEKILEIIREYENRLCANTERGKYNKFSTGLSEKFQNEVKKRFPLIDHVGLIVENEAPNKTPEFTIKKISLS